MCLECSAENYGVNGDEDIISCEDGNFGEAATPTCGEGYYLNPNK